MGGTHSALNVLAGQQPFVPPGSEVPSASLAPFTILGRRPTVRGLWNDHRHRRRPALRVRIRWRFDVPPHTPEILRSARAKSTHSSHTGHLAQTAFAATVDAPRSTTKHATGRPRQAARASHIGRPSSSATSGTSSLGVMSPTTASACTGGQANRCVRNDRRCPRQHRTQEGPVASPVVSLGE